MLANRDASIIVRDDEVAAYFAEIFDFDWDRASSVVTEAPVGVTIHEPGQPIPPGYEAVTWQELLL